VSQWFLSVFARLIQALADFADYAMLTAIVAKVSVEFIRLRKGAGKESATLAQCAASARRMKSPARASN
jgi:hypothetical protein